MKRRLNWHRISREALSTHLKTVEVVRSEAIGDACLYRCQSNGSESVAIALPGDVALIIDLQFEIPAALERRRSTGENSALDE